MLAKTYVERLTRASDFVKARINDIPDIGIILGSGLGSYGDELINPIRIPYKEIPEMLDTTVPGHSGCLIFGKVGERKVLCLSGRSHQYEGLYPHEVQFAIRLLAVCGCKLCILTNAAGTRDPDMNVGDLAPMLDHLNGTFRGYTEEPLVQKDFNHLIQVNMYDAAAQATAREVATEMGLQTKGCVYTYNFGPTYETSAEVEGEYKMGGTNFGMSTVPEVIAMKEMGVPVFAMSFCTNKAAGVDEAKLCHEDVTIAAKAGEPKMRALISEVIKRTPLKDVAIPTLIGDDNVIARVAPKEFASDEEITKVAAMFGETKVDALVVLGACHALEGFEPATVVNCDDLPKFPILQQTKMQLKIGSVEGRQVVVADGFRDLCGADGYQLHYIIALAAKLGAKAYVQTFSSGTFGEGGVKAVDDIIPFFERVVVPPRVCKKYEEPSLELPKAILASYFGPEFPSAHDAGAVKYLGATDICLGTVKGLMIARAFGMKATGICDSAYDAVLGEADSIDSLLAKCRAASPAVAAAVKSVIGKVEAVATPTSTFVATEEKGVAWNDTPVTVQNKQEDPARVEEIAKQLPDVEYVLLLKEKGSVFESLKARLPQETNIGCCSVYSGELFGKKVALGIGCRCMTRAFASKKIPMITIGRVIVSDNAKVGDSKYVTFIDHFNISGVYALVGHNLSGPRFPDMSHLYTPVAGLPEVVAFNMADARFTTQAYANGMVKIGCHVATDFGPEQATLSRHQGAEPIKHIGVVVKCMRCEWSIDDAVLEKALQ